MRKIIREGEKYPRGYGLAYIRYWLDEAVCYPIPLNVLVALLYRLKWWLKSPGIKLYELGQARAKGWEAGYAAAKRVNEIFGDEDSLYGT